MGRLIPALVVLALAVDAHAQGDPRALFEEGTAAIHEGAPRRAIELLERSLAIRARAATAYNLALALQLDEQLLAANTMCSALLSDTYGPLAVDRRERATARCQQIAASIPRIHVRVHAVGTIDGPIDIQVDGETRVSLQSGAETEIPVDPGDHVVRASARGAMGETVRARFVVGDRRSIPLRLRGNDASEDASSSIRRRRILGVLGAVVAAGALGLGLGLGLRPSESPSMGTFPPVGT